MRGHAAACAICASKTNKTLTFWGFPPLLTVKTKISTVSDTDNELYRKQGGSRKIDIGGAGSTLIRILIF